MALIDCSRNEVIGVARKARSNAKARILEYLMAYTDEHGYSPTYLEIAQAVGFRSTSTIRRYIALLEAEGILEARSKRTRTVKPRKKITLSDTNEGCHQRVRLEVVDGGAVYFDCALAKQKNGSLGVEFSGVLDASELKKKVGLLVCCSVDSDGR